MPDNADVEGVGGTVVEALELGGGVHSDIEIDEHTSYLEMNSRRKRHTT